MKSKALTLQRQALLLVISQPLVSKSISVSLHRHCLGKRLHYGGFMFFRMLELRIHSFPSSIREEKQKDGLDEQDEAIIKD